MLEIIEPSEYRVEIVPQAIDDASCSIVHTKGSFHGKKRK